MNFSRKHINNNQIPEIELDKLDEFELDAREGWSELEIEDLNRLDLRFKANRSGFKLSFTVLFFSSFIISILLYEAHKRENYPKEVSKKYQSHTNTINEAYNPIKLPNKKLELIAQHKQIIPQKIQSDLKPIRSFINF